ncbi:MAG: PAS domain S-box protein [bacterium]|nr:PAS domain S-box protein [bacterium]
MTSSFSSAVKYFAAESLRMALMSLGGTLVCLISLLFLMIFKRVKLFARIVLYFMFLSITYTIMSEEIMYMPRLLLYIFPMMALFLLGILEGSALSFALIMIMALDLSHNHAIEISETHNQAIIRFIMTFSSILLLTLIYEIIRGMSQRNLNDKKKELEHTLERMSVTQKRMAEANDYLYKIYNLIPSAIYTVDEKQRITSINKRALDILGYTEKELLGNDCRIFALKPCREKCALLSSETKKPLLGRVCSIVTKSGVERTISKNADNLYDSDGNVTGGVESFEDITEKFKKDEEIKKLSYVVSQSPASIVMTDTEGNIEYVNPKFTTVSGYTYEEAIGKNPRILKSGDKTDADYKILWDKITSGEEWRGEFHNKRKDGSLYWEMALISPIRDEKNNIKHFVAVKEDITAKKKMEAELTAAKERAEAATKAKSEFLANMSHEIRTPMNGIIGMTELMLDTKLDEEQSDYIKIIKQSSITLLTLINDILDFSKIESGKMVFEEIEFDLYELINMALKPMQAEASKRKLELIADVERTTPRFIKSDPTRLKQIIVNLIGNAVKFTSKGEILLRAFLLEREKDEVSIQFDVEDTGIGIDREKIDLIFEPFEQADGSITRNFGGTGLGTTISKYIVEKLNGKIWASSPSSLPKNDGRGRGACFSFTIKAGESATRCSADDRIPDLESRKFIIIDDNPINLRIFSKILSNWNIRSDGFFTVDDAIEHMKRTKESYSFALVDYNLADMKGTEAIRKLSQADSEIRFIMVSSSFSHEETKECRAAGAETCLSKPVTQSSLYDAIMSMLNRKTLLTETEIKGGSLEISGESLNVLLAEDNLVNQKVAKFVIEKMGHKITIAGNGNEVLQKMSSDSFDVILMDVQMPQMDGLTTTKIIREYEVDVKNKRQNAYVLKIKSERMPIIALTAHAMKEDRELCISNGMDDYVSKPLQISELRRVFENVINGEYKVK